MNSAYQTMVQIKNEYGPKTKVKFGGIMTVDDALKKIKTSARREGIKIKSKKNRKVCDI